MKNIFSKATAHLRLNVSTITAQLRSIYGSPILLFAFLTLGVGQMWGAWTGNAGICVNGEWYKASDHIDGGNWLSGKTTFNGTNLGAITSLELGGQYDNYDDNKEDNCGWNSNNGIWITITTNGGTQIDNFKLSCYHAEKSGNNNIWKTTGTTGDCGDGSEWAAYSVDISGYAAGVYKLKVHWFSASGVALPSSGDDVATFTINPVVTFKANGGTGSDYTQRVTYNTSTALTACTFTRTGYGFAGWATSSDGSVEYADGANVSLTAHTDLYAKWTPEETHDVTVYYKCGTMTIKNSTTETGVGVTTTRSVSAPGIDDHTFSSWSAGSGVKTNSSTSATPISINSKGSGTYSLTANYTLVPCSLCVGSTATFATPGTKYLMSYDATKDAYYYDMASTPENLYFRFAHGATPTYYSATWNGNYPNVNSVTANESKLDYCKVDVSGWTNKSSIHFSGLEGSAIRIWYDYQNEQVWITETTYSVAVSSESTSKGTVSAASVTAGKNTAAAIDATPKTGYKFKQWSVTSPATLVSSATTKSNSVKTTNTGGAVQAQFEHRFVLRGSIDADGNPAGGMAGWDATDNSAYASATISDGVMTITANLTKAKTKYKFKIYDLSDSSWKGQTETTDIPDNTARTLSGGNNVTLTTTAAGTYTFVYTVSSHSIKVLFPSPVYSVTYGVQSGTGTVTAKIGTESIGASPGKAVGGANVVMTASDGTGYQFQKWVNESGTQISTSNPYTISSIAANCTIKAVFTARNYTAANNLKEADGTANGQYNVTYDNTSIAHTSAPSRTGYTVEGYYKQAAWTNKIASTNLSLVASTDYATSASKWKVTSAPDLYIKWQQTLTLAGNGAGSTNGSVTTTYLGTASSHTAATRTGYTLNGYYDNTSGGNKILTNTGALVSYSASVSSYINSAGKWIYDGTPTLSAQWTANNYDVTLKANTGTGDDQLVQATYDVAMPLTLKNSSTAITVHTKTGYTLLGYWDDASSGNQYYSYNAGTSTLSSYRTWNKDAATNLFAHWSANTYRVTLDVDEEHKGDIASATTYQDVTYDGSTTTVPNRPTAEQGYGLEGYYTDHNGAGTKVINGDGTFIASVDGYTDGDKKWIRADGVTLYAYYKQAEITNLTFDAAVVAPSTEVGVTPTVAPTPDGTNSICWKLLYNNGNLYDPQPTFSPGSGNKVTFTAPPTSGMYLVAAVLRTGSSCDGGTKLDSVTYSFQVAGDHTVTVQYKCGDETIAPSTTVTGRPLVWSEVVAHDIFGYTFSGWTAGDGVTLRDTTPERLADLQAEDETIVAVTQMKAIYDGRLTANYTQNQIIYFKNTLGWENVYVNFHTGNAWNNDNNPQGSPKGVGNKGLTNRNKHMIQIDESDVYYYDYGTEGISPSLFISFTNKSRDGVDEFWAENPGISVSYPANYADAISTNKSAENGFKAATPMFVPLADQTPVAANVTGTGKANYYNSGYWTTYTPGTGYTLEIYNDAGSSLLKSIEFTSEDDLMPMKAVADLEAGKTYKYQIRRGGTGSNGIYYGNERTMTYTDHGQNTAWQMWNTMDGGFKKAGITTTAAGDYTFNLSYSPNNSGHYRLRMKVDYPIANGDYRVIYTDNTRTGYKPSAIVTKANNAKDTVSFFIRPNSSPVMKIQQATVAGDGTITWSAGTDISSSVSSPGLAATGVYNICLQMDGSGAISVENVEAYTGNFYIRTDAANSKWDNYRAADHLMTYSEYSETHSDYTHYFVKFVSQGTNVKFVVANDYSPCISDTLKVQTYRGGDSDHVDGNGFLNSNLPGDGVNVRYMWDIRNNAVYRAYLAPAQRNGSKFLVLRSNSSDDLRNEYDVALTGDSYETPGNSHGGGANCMQFVDNENWIYEATVMVRPSAYVKLYGHFHGTNFYFKGNNNDEFNGTKIDGIPNAIQLVTGSTGSRVKVRVIYDFKTDRLVAAYMPSGNIDEQMAINADVMFIREHQGDIDQLTFSEKDSKMGAITNIKTAYAVMRFNKWTLNNKEKTGSHNPLASPASIYERSLYYVSFPFPVNLNEVFGFGTYGQHWIIQRYRGDLRAQQGFWAESAGFWEFIWNRNGVVLQPNEGYILTLETELLGETSDVWGPESVANQVELYFPSTGSLGSITNASITQTLPAHTCTINRAATEGLPDTSDPSTSYNRTIFDSHWNIMSVPTYFNVNNPSFANTTWIANDSCPKFLYTWNPDDNTLTATSGTGFVYHAMHAYTVQYYGNVTWTTSVTPTAAPQRNTEYRGEYEFCLEVQQDEQMIDRTFVRLSDDEKVTTGFEFGEDMTKQFNSRKANIFTIAGNTSLGGNSLPLSTTQTTVVPVGVSIRNAGDYTFAIPEGTEGIGVTLVDNETGVRTSLSALDYTVTLQPGDYTGRFVLEISPIAQTPTGVETVTGEGLPVTGVRKVMIDGILYIVKDGKIFDARGARVE